MKKVNIVLVKIANRNLGDTVIYENVRFLIDKMIPTWRREKYNIIPYNIYSNNLELLCEADVIIFVGGGIIKYKYEMFYEYISRIIGAAEERGVPVFFNGVGVEGYDINNANARSLRDAINSNCVKGITVRDDVKLLKEHYIYNKNIAVTEVMDPAIWTKWAYNLNRKSESKEIGIGIIRHGIFNDNGIDAIDKEIQLEFWKSILERLNLEGLEWKVFTNGMKADEVFADEVLQYAGYDSTEKYKAKRFSHGKELVECISGFGGIIACRMHSNIIAYSLQIPSVAIVWNDKLKFWGKKIEHSERFIDVNDMNADLVVERLLQAMKQKQSKPSLRMRYTSFLSLEMFLLKYAKKNKNKAKNEEWWSTHLVAQALGGMNQIYANTNTLEAFTSSYNNGFRWFESDVRLTSDGEIVCINGWNTSSYSILQLEKDSLLRKEMTLEEFSNQSYYGNYKTNSFSELINGVKAYKGIRLFLDIGKPQKERSEYFYKKLIEEIPSDFVPNIIVCVQRKRDALLIRQMRYNLNIAYYLDENITDDNVDEFVEFCVQRDIGWVTVKAKNFNESYIKKLHQFNIKIYLFSEDNLNGVNSYIERGVDMIGTNYLSVNELHELYTNK